MKNDMNEINLSHGSGGKLMHDLISAVFKARFSNEILDRLSDSAVIDLSDEDMEDLCFTTDSYVVDPLFFPGGDIGKLAVCGTVNDLSVEGARPMFLSCGVITEEGLDMKTLERIVDSMSETAKNVPVKIVTGDFKVVPRGKADRIFINTAGIGVRKKGLSPSGKSAIKPGDRIIINGPLGQHGIAVLSARGEFELEMDIQSDCASLFSLISAVLNASDGVRFMRDPTRGGVSTTLNELTSDAGFGLLIKEDTLPLPEEIRGACELLGFDPLFLANEGKVIMVVDANESENILKVMKNHPLGKESCIIGEVIEDPVGKVIMETSIGSRRILDMPVGEQLPRIC